MILIILFLDKEKYFLITLSLPIFWRLSAIVLVVNPTTAKSFGERSINQISGITHPAQIIPWSSFGQNRFSKINITLIALSNVIEAIVSDYIKIIW